MLSLVFETGMCYELASLAETRIFPETRSVD